MASGPERRTQHCTHIDIGSNAHSATCQNHPPKKANAQTMHWLRVCGYWISFKSATQSRAL
eukprot:6630352-Alexandrium_andersonii.AAC.1